MTRGLSIRTVAIVALLLPGLVMAAPIVGACGLCGDGDDCHMQRSLEPATEPHSCCDTETERAPEPSLGSSSCECGRDAPPAVTATTPTTLETASAATTTPETINLTSPVGTAFSFSARLATPPPAPPAYLIDCAFLT
ncbi:MAG: hypothetical protein IFK92_02790 [Acidobacteria bacterium]|nr:hypothetical protein [Candidatus Sulfomarinibacter kjeldsenii]